MVWMCGVCVCVHICVIVYMGVCVLGLDVWCVVCVYVHICVMCVYMGVYLV